MWSQMLLLVKCVSKSDVELHACMQVKLAEHAYLHLCIAINLGGSHAGLYYVILFVHNNSPLLIYLLYVCGYLYLPSNSVQLAESVGSCMNSITIVLNCLAFTVLKTVQGSVMCHTHTMTGIIQ